MRIRGTDFVMFTVSNLAAAAHFYRDVLGLRQELFSPEYQWAEYDCGNVTLALHGGARRVAARGGARLALAVDDIDSAFAAMKAARVPIVCPRQNHGVCRSLEVADPDGNIIVLHRRADGTFGPDATPATPILCHESHADEKDETRRHARRAAARTDRSQPGRHARSSVSGS